MTELLSILPQLGVGSLTVLALVYVMLRFLKENKDQQAVFLAEISKRDDAYRSLEKEVRTSIARQLSQATHHLDKASKVIDRNSAVMERAIQHLAANQK